MKNGNEKFSFVVHHINLLLKGKWTHINVRINKFIVWKKGLWYSFITIKFSNDFTTTIVHTWYYFRTPFDIWLYYLKIHTLLEEGIDSQKHNPFSTFLFLVFVFVERNQTKIEKTREFLSHLSKEKRINWLFFFFFWIS